MGSLKSASSHELDTSSGTSTTSVPAFDRASATGKTGLLGFDLAGDMPDDSNLEDAMATILNKRGEGTVQSDRRLKKDIRPRGRTHSGIPLYQFRYKGFPQTFIGVMAQDVLQEPHLRSAVANVNGHYSVDYAKLGLAHLVTDEMRRVGLRCAQNALRSNA